jgi:hypothetical protein
MIDIQVIVSFLEDVIKSVAKIFVLVSSVERRLHRSSL